MNEYDCRTCIYRHKDSCKLVGYGAGNMEEYQCAIRPATMTCDAAVKVLHDYQCYRRGRGTIADCPTPYLIGIAIDTAIRLMRENRKDREQNTGLVVETNTNRMGKDELLKLFCKRHGYDIRLSYFTSPDVVWLSDGTTIRYTDIATDMTQRPNPEVYDRFENYKFKLERAGIEAPSFDAYIKHGETVSDRTIDEIAALRDMQRSVNNELERLAQENGFTYKT